MSSLSISLPKKFSDAQFIGDLMSLFERRKVKCGDVSSYTSFASELASNNKLRSDLFTLCTAISHMAAEDLSGEELLVLVARALSGTGVAKGSAVPEIPGEMRTAFLEGYAAWNNRAAAAMDGASEWPPQRRALPADEVAPLAEEGSEVAAAKSPAEGGRTIQEALELARERSPNGLLVPRQSTPGPNIEHLTISELKKLLDEIEHRVSRIGPHLSQAPLTSRGDLDAGERSSRDAGIFDASTRTAEPAREDILHVLRGAVLPFESAARPPAAGAPVSPPPMESPSDFNEAAFLRRHPYLKAERADPVRAAATSPSVGAVPVESVPAVVSLPTAPAPVAEVAAAPAKVEYVAPVAPVVAAPVVNADAVPVAAPLAIAQPLQPRAEVIPPAGVPRTVIQTDAWYPPSTGGAHVSIRVKIGSILAVAGFFVIAGSLSGIFVYRSMHPKTIDDFPSLRTPAPSANTPDSQVIIAVPDALEEPSKPTRTLRESGGTTKPSKVRPAIQRSPPVAVWPPSSTPVSRDTGSEPVAGSTSATSRHTSPVSVPATTMIGYAQYSPKPAYPAERAKGISGTVELEVSVSKRGNVTSARAVSGPPELRRAAEQAVEEWRFRPYLVGGDPTDVTTTVGFFFNGR